MWPLREFFMKIVKCIYEQIFTDSIVVYETNRSDDLNGAEKSAHFLDVLPRGFSG